jgi:hypothetical protein
VVHNPAVPFLQCGPSTLFLDLSGMVWPKLDELLQNGEVYLLFFFKLIFLDGVTLVLVLAAVFLLDAAVVT